MPLDDTVAVQEVLQSAAEQLGVELEEAEVDLHEVLA
jgi:hypothetical protein